MKKVLYVITSAAHKRVFESFVERPDMEQMVIGPQSKKGGMIPEDYRDFGLKTIRHYNKNDLHKTVIDAINDFEPDIYVQPDLSPTHNQIHAHKHKKQYKKVYVSHGLVGNHVKDIIKPAGFNTSVWLGMDLYCGATQVFADWIKHVANVDDSKILLNAVPQFDIIHNPDYRNAYKEKILAKTKHPNAKKVILFIGFCCRDRVDFDNHNEDYFRAAITLARQAEQEDWLVMIKPRQEHGEMIKFLKTHKWGVKYINDYVDLQNNKHIHFITAADAHIYRYYFADAFVLNGCSTAELEACAIQKPLFMVRTDYEKLESYDPYCTVTNRAAMGIVDTAELEHCLYSYFKDGKYHWPESQKKLLESMNIAFDGKMHERVQNKLMEL